MPPPPISRALLAIAFIALSKNTPWSLLRSSEAKRWW
jgi:hypothetical protein